MKNLKPKWNLLYPEKENEVKVRFRKAGYNNDVTSLNRFLSKLPKVKNTDSGGSVRRPWVWSSQNQFVAMKMRYSYNKDTHSVFLKRYMPQKDKEEVKEKPKLFGTDEKEYKKNMSKKHFRFIISPESQDIPMELYVKKIVEEMEKATGYTFHWQAVVHTDTPNVHAHLLINGFDKNRKEVFFSKDMLTRQFFDIASELATSIIGERTREQKQSAKERWAVAKRFTHIDKELLSRLKNGKVSYRNEEERKRLIFLEELQLAHFEKDKTFRLHSNLESILATNGKYNVFLDVRSKYREEVAIYDLATMGELRGSVVEVRNQDDDKNWYNALVIRDKNNRLYFVPTQRPEKLSLVGKEVVLNKKEMDQARSKNDREK